MKKFTSREDCVKIFESYNIPVSRISDLIVEALGNDDNDKIEIRGLPNKAFLDNDLNVVYNNGKRYNKLEKAIKFFASI